MAEPVKTWPECMKGDQRLLGACHGTAMAMVDLRPRLGDLAERMRLLPARHTRRRAALAALHAELRVVYDRLETRLRSHQAVYRGEVPALANRPAHDKAG